MIWPNCTNICFAGFYYTQHALVPLIFNTKFVKFVVLTVLIPSFTNWYNSHSPPLPLFPIKFQCKKINYGFKSIM